MKIAVIGAGIIGVSAARVLQKGGHEVTLIDRAGIGEGCSKGNAGHIANEYIFPLSSPKTIMEVPSMLLNPNGPLIIRWSYMPRIFPWLIRFFVGGATIQNATQHGCDCCTAQRSIIGI